MRYSFFADTFDPAMLLTSSFDREKQALMVIVDVKLHAEASITFEMRHHRQA